MKRQWRPACVLLILLLASGWRAAGEGMLKTRGVDVVDERGEKVMLRGVGLGNWLLPEGYMWKFGNQADRPRRIEKLVSDLIGEEQAAKFWSEFRNNYITEADIARLSELGFNCVRPALNARLFTKQANDRGVPEGFRLLDNLVRWCGKHHVYVIIDMHAAPGGQTGQNIDDSADDQPRLFMSAENEEALVSLWVQLAQRYAHEPWVAAYDLLNEPLPQRTGAEAKYKARLEPLYKRLTAAIRRVDPAHMITVEGADWANDWSVFGPPFDRNLLYQFHYYAWDRPDNVKGVDKYLHERERLNAPIWVGETGEKDNTIYWATTDYFEANNIGWSFWPWKKLDTRNTPYSIKPPAGWEEITACSRGGARPSREKAQAILDEYLRNIRLDACQFFPDVVSAMFRRVPGRVEAENYGHEGAGKSYSVTDPARRAEAYRKGEPVAIERLAGGTNSWRSEQAIKLHSGEWTAYTIHSLESRQYEVVARVRGETGAGPLQVLVNGRPQEASVTGNDWTELKLKPVALSKGTNQLKLVATKGIVAIDWLEFQ